MSLQIVHSKSRPDEEKIRCSAKKFFFDEIQPQWLVGK